MTARNPTRKHWRQPWFVTSIAPFRASLHTPSSLVCNAAESNNLSQDDLRFDKNLPLATRYKEQNEDRGRQGSARRNSRKKYEEQQTTNSNNNTCLKVKRKRIFRCNEVQRPCMLQV